VQARTDASFVRETGDSRLMRIPAYFATPPVVVNDGQDYNIDNTSQPRPQGGAVEQAGIEI